MEGAQEQKASNQSPHNSKSLRDQFLQQMMQDVDGLIDKLDAVTDKLDKRFAKEVRASINDLHATMVEVVGVINAERRSVDKAREEHTQQLVDAVKDIKNMLANTPQAIKRTWRNGFLLGVLLGCLVSGIFITVLPYVI